MTEDYFAIPTLENAFLREIPLKRLSTIENIANAALWLASDESRSTTGQITWRNVIYLPIPIASTPL